MLDTQFHVLCRGANKHYPMRIIYVFQALVIVDWGCYLLFVDVNSQPSKGGGFKPLDACKAS